jgi:hypothetical protein
MKIFTLQFIILLAFFQTVNAQSDTVYIDCPGVVGGTWTPDNRYIARCDVFVPYDSTLTIQPGVQIEFQEGYAFKVEGQLTAIGTAGNRIAVSPYEQNWEGITFGTPSGETILNSSTLSYVDFDCGGNSNNSEAVVVGKHKISSINNLRISHAEKGIRVTGFADIDNISACEFMDVTTGVLFQYCDVVSAIQIENCKFENILERGVMISQNQAFLDEISIAGCDFDNSALATNLSESAIHITLNIKLTSIAISNSSFNSFAWNNNSPATIYISDNAVLETASLSLNEIRLCGGESPTSPNADFGGIYLNQGNRVILDANEILGNTGKKSGAGYLKAEEVLFSDNIFRDNRNNYTGNENFAGAFTITAGNRIEADGDSFSNNFSAKSAGALYIESKSNANPVDLLFSGITLEANGAANEGGAILINATLDTLGVTNSTIDGNYSSAGSGGCFSIISSAFNDLTIKSNNILDNFVSENSDGGFLYLRHDPSQVPSYGNILLSQNICSVSGHNANSNYNLVYSKVKSFPGSITISEDQVTDFYPVEGNLYHFELLESGPDPEEQAVSVSLHSNEFQGNRCPIFFFANNYCSVDGSFVLNTVEGNAASIGTFLTIECLEASNLNFANEQYSNLVSGTSGGAVSVSTVKEIGIVLIDDITSENCFAVEGNGGHFYLSSGSTNTAAAQSLTLAGSAFTNEGMDEVTGGNGGAVYYYTPGNLALVSLGDCNFGSIRTEVSGGAVYVEASAIADASLLGSEFEYIYSNEGDGAVCFKAFNGNINTISIIPDTEEGVSFNGCYGELNGGAVSAIASGEIGTVLIQDLVSNNCSVMEGNGGHISLISQGSDQSVSQNLQVEHSAFENANVEPAGNDGGVIYYKTNGDISSINISNTSFEIFKIFGDGGGLFFEAKSIGLIDVFHSGFYSLKSLDAMGGAVYMKAFDGNIGQVINSQCIFSGCSAKLDGGAFYAEASKEIGSITFDSVSSTGNIAFEGNGGHHAFISGSSDQALAQELLISISEFDNTGMTSVTGGNGGAIYYRTPGNLALLDVSASAFSGLKAGGKAGAICVTAKETGDINFAGSGFFNNTSLDTAGAVYINASNGNIARLQIVPLENIPTTFASCSSKYDGGAILARASREIGTVIIDTAEITKCFSDDGNGGHISLISLGTDPALAQNLSISGSVFSNEGLSSITGGNGGMIYYNALSDLASVTVTGSEFRNATSVKDGGSIYLEAGKIESLDVSASLFSSSVATVLSGGALFVKTDNGLIDAEFTANRFLNCSSGLMGGSVYIEDAKYDNANENINWTSNIYRRIDQDIVPETGGAVYCKGINAVRFESDSSISQASADKGGFLYLEKVYRAAYESLYTYGNTSGTGGVIYHSGDDQTSFSQSSRFFNSTFLFNTAAVTGGCFYITGIDSVEIGKEGAKNTFVANQSFSAISNDQVGGGVFLIQDAIRLDVSYNSFYVNKSQNNGGIGIVSNVSSSLLMQGNSFLSNQASAGGAFAFINSFTEGVIADNMFSHNTSTEQAGALLFSPAATHAFTIRDNTFFKNSSGKLGGAIASYRPVRLTRNLFRENHLTDINPNFDHKGTTVYLGSSGDQALIKNCVFDQNFYEENPLVASIYFDDVQTGFPPFNIANCSFFNFSDEHLSVYNENGQDTVVIQNSIFTQRQNTLRDDPVVYFNETVRSMYSDLIYSQIDDPVDHNSDEYIYFNIGDYYFDSEQFPVDQGNPDPSFNDNHMPPGYGTERNDQGISGGPDNPDTNGVFIFHEPVNLPTNFDIVVLSHDCFTYTFECRGEFVSTYEYFYWFMPDSIIRTESAVLTYTFPQDLTGNQSITALGHDVSNSDIYGFGQYTVNLDIIRINSVKTTYNGNLIPVSSVPFTFTIEADIYHENDTPYSWEWTVVESPGVVFNMSGTETLNSVEIVKITALPASITVKYTLEACGRVLENTITITLQTTELWGYPNISFYPEPDNIPDTTSFFIITFDKIMTKADGTELTDSELGTYFGITYPGCPDLDFRRSVDYNYNTNQTVITINQFYTSTQQPGMLCNGEYVFEVDYDQLFTQFYRLNRNDTSKTYSVCCNDISENGGGLIVSAYPNPFRDIVHISFPETDDYNIEISDLQGNLQKSGRYAGVNEVIINLGALSDGVYILHAVNSRSTRQYYLKINKINN